MPVAPRLELGILQTYTGRMISALNPKPADIDPVDVAHHLSLLNRFNGGTRFGYSVAQHCYLGSYQIHSSLAYEFLLHDVEEYMIGDICSPIKRVPEFRDVWKPIEKRWEQAVCDRFGVSFEDPRIKDCDLRMLATEKRDIMHGGGPLWTWSWLGEGVEVPKPYPNIIQEWTPQYAERAWLTRFHALSARRLNVG